MISLTVCTFDRWFELTSALYLENHWATNGRGQPATERRVVMPASDKDRSSMALMGTGVEPVYSDQLFVHGKLSIGRGINALLADLPEGTWVCRQDADTVLLPDLDLSDLDPTCLYSTLLRWTEYRGWRFLLNYDFPAVDCTHPLESSLAHQGFFQCWCHDGRRYPEQTSNGEDVAFASLWPADQRRLLPGFAIHLGYPAAGHFFQPEFRR